MAFSRRAFLLGTATVSAAWMTWGGLPARALAPDRFMQLSALLVNHRLDAATGARIAAAAAGQYPDAAAMAGSIVGIAQASKATQVEDFFEAIPEGPLRDFAHWVIFAWYTGCSSAQKNAQVFAYETALTYQTTADAVAIPSYGFSGPNLWHRPLVPLSPMPRF